MARAMGVYFMVMGMLVISLSVGGRRVEAQVHHVVGGDRGWHPSSDIESWSSSRSFRVGDNIWFSYSAVEENITELATKEEYERCDISNPIKMYTDGVNRVGLGAEGIRYFVSGKPENCKNGLKLHVEVLPRLELQSQTTNTSTLNAQALAAGPTPSGSVGLSKVSTLVWFGLGLVGCVGWVI